MLYRLARIGLSVSLATLALACGPGGGGATGGAAEGGASSTTGTGGSAQGGSSGTAGAGGSAQGGAGGTGGAGGAGAQTPWGDEIFYSIVVDRFFDGDPGNDGSPSPNVDPIARYAGGDWAGITQKIQEGYFTDLGVTALLLTVPMENADTVETGADGHAYEAFQGLWVTDEGTAEGHFGTKQALTDLVAAAHGAGLEVLWIVAPHHVHAAAQVVTDHPDWFTPMCLCADPACIGGNPASPTCWARPYLPTYDLSVAAARTHTLDHAIAWLSETGADGYEIDAVGRLAPEWVPELRQRATAEIEPLTGQHVFLTAPMFTGDPSQLEDLIDPASLLDGTDHLLLRAELLRSVLMRKTPMTDLSSALAAYQEKFGASAQRTLLGNRGTPRAVHFAQDTPIWSNEWDDGEALAWGNPPSLPAGTSAFERMGVAFAVLFTLGGIPEIYYGDELGLPGAGVPDNMRVMTWSGATAGQLALRERVKSLAHARKGHEALRHGDFTVLSAGPDTLVYRREKGADLVLVALNRGDTMAVADGIPASTWSDVLTGDTVAGPAVDLPPRSARILVPAP